jgi:Flp pilus assembly protein TadD
MTTALALAPQDRHILRSAARLYLHVDDPERAHDLLKRNAATETDPWLMASEIAVSAVAHRKPVFFKKGREFLEEGGVNPRHISELAAAIGTVHLKDGNRKARKLFSTSLIDPTGNSLAQAEWASPHVGNLVRPQALHRVQDTAEAEVFHAYWDGRLADVIGQCETWHLDEPFSSRPQQFGSGAAITLERFEAALAFADEGLKANPKVIGLINNRAFALISLGRFDEAFRVLHHCLIHYPEEAQGSITATAGLLAMRLQQFEEGKRRYRQAISYFRKVGQSLMEALAIAYFAQEACRAELPDAPRILIEAKEKCKDIKFFPEVGIVLRRAELWVGAVAQRKSIEGRVL